MNKKLLILPLIIVCLIAGIFIGSCGKTETNVNASNINDKFRKLDNISHHNFYLWIDEETDKEYILYHNSFYNEFSICPR